MEASPFATSRIISLGSTPLTPLSRTQQQAYPDYSSTGNSISTTKFTWWSFLPKGLYEQFRRIANAYFLLIAALSLTPVSPVNPVTNVFPLTVVLAVSLVKEAIEDAKRRQKDSQINSSLVLVMRGGMLSHVQWRDVMVGDIVKVEDRKYFPADLVLLSSSNPEGMCYVETMNLDGETNLKIKKALQETCLCDSEENLANLEMEIECELPNNSLYTFMGNVHLGSQTVALSTNQILLRGCMLRNTHWVYGAVIYTGHQSKVMMNATGVPSKRSSLERRLDWLIVLMFGILAVMCSIGAIGSVLSLDTAHWYLKLGAQYEPSDSKMLFDPAHPVTVGLLNFMTFIILYSTLIPISLYVSIEVIKYFQATKFINKDLEMYDAETNTPALARTSNLNEELGQIQYIFSDKTGTLTCNNMEFFKCSIAGVKYGRGVTEIERTLASRAGIQLTHEAASASPFREPAFNFDDARLMGCAWRADPDASTIREFLKLLAVCHTVIPEGDLTPSAIKYQASSPDEAALVVAAKVFGFFFHGRTTTSITVRQPDEDSTLGIAADKNAQYEILAVLEFNSTRKRQSVIVRQPDGSILLQCKGADTVIYERLSKAGRQFASSTLTHLEEFGNQGLRTLCLAYRVVGEVEYMEWEVVFRAAKTAMVDRDGALEAAAELIERDLVLLGATAIEDKLQAGVPKCIERLRQAGMKIWVLTGDKVETAINIGYACSLLTNAQHRLMIHSETAQLLEAERRDDPNLAAITKREVVRQLRGAMEAADVNSRLAEPADLACVLDGKALQVMLRPGHKSDLLKLGLQCKAVMCCRVSPLQKAQVTRMVKDGAGQITLAIGDGANDVSMIQAAHVGVGISGQEGMQAVMAADFAIAQFRFLENLLLVHGRWNYKRIARIVGYFFYKNMTYTLTQFWFNIYASYSGQRLYDDWYQAFYNLLFTSLPVIVVGLLDQDVSKESAQMMPQLYIPGQLNTDFGCRVLGMWLLAALWNSVVCFYLPLMALTPVAVNKAGLMIDIWATGTLAYTLIVISVNMRLAMCLRFHTAWHMVAICGSVGIWLLFVLVYNYLPLGLLGSLAKQDNTYNVIYLLISWPAAWLVIPVGLAACLLPNMAMSCAQRMLWPQDHIIVQEHEANLERRRMSMNGGRVRVVGEVQAYQLWDPVDVEGGARKASHNKTQSRWSWCSGPDPSSPIQLNAIAQVSVAPQRPKTCNLTAHDGVSNASQPAVLRRTHTGFSFDHPGSDSHFAQEAKKEEYRAARRTTGPHTYSVDGIARPGIVSD